jgi:hypothetical protein
MSMAAFYNDGREMETGQWRQKSEVGGQRSGGEAKSGNLPSLRSFRLRQGRYGGQDGGTRAEIAKPGAEGQEQAKI